MYMKTITEFYESPDALVQELTTEGVLCSSMKETMLDDYDFEEFEW